MTAFSETLLLTDREIIAAEIRHALAHDRADVGRLVARQREITAWVLSKNKDNGE